MNEIIQEFARVLKNPINSYEGHKYERMNGALRVDDCYCATGVLCDLLVKNNPDRFSWQKSKNNIVLFGNGKPVMGSYSFIDRSDKTIFGPVGYYTYSIPDEITDPLGLPEYIIHTDSVKNILNIHGSGTVSLMSKSSISFMNDNGVSWEAISEILKGLPSQ